MIQEITKVDEPGGYLHTICAEIDVFDYKDKKGAVQIIRDLKDTIKTHVTAVGLAANQIGQPFRIFLFTNAAGYVQEIVNPEIIDSSEETTSIPEGCLSVPGAKVEVSRPLAIKVSGYDKDMMPIHFTLLGAEALIFQHELDHLNGKTILDYENNEEVEDNVT
jgi:peptide deformylase